MLLATAALPASSTPEPVRRCLARCTHRPFSRPLVSIEFDDGYEDAYRLGLPIVECFGWSAQMNVVTGLKADASEADRRDYMTDEQIVDWSHRGDIASHSVTHPALTRQTTGRITTELSESRRHLEALLDHPIATFVTPGCDHDQRVTDIAKRFYDAVRNCDPNPYVNDNHDFDRWNLRAYPVKRDIPSTWLLDQLDQTKATNGWSIFFWHRIDDTPTGDAYTSTTEQLRRDLQLIRDSGVTVVSSRDALREELG